MDPEMKWPVAVVAVVSVIAIVTGITITTLHDSSERTQQERARVDLQISCIQAGGEVGERNGWPTCKSPR